MARHGLATMPPVILPIVGEVYFKTKTGIYLSSKKECVVFNSFQFRRVYHKVGWCSVKGPSISQFLAMG